MKPLLSSMVLTTGVVLVGSVGDAQAHGPLAVLDVLAWTAASTDAATCGALDQVPQMVRTTVGPAVYDGAGGYQLLCPSRIGPSPTLALVADGAVLAASVSGGLRASSDGGCTFRAVEIPAFDGVTPLLTDARLGVDAGQLDPVDRLLVFGRVPDVGLLGTLEAGGEIRWVVDWPRVDADETPRALLPTTAFAAEGAGRWWTAGLFPSPRLSRVRRGPDGGTGPTWLADPVELGPQPPAGVAPATEITGLDLGRGDGMYVALAAEGDAPWARVWWREGPGSPWVERWAGTSLRGPVLADNRVWWVGDAALWVDDPRGVTWVGKRLVPTPVPPRSVVAADWTCLQTTPNDELAGCAGTEVVVLDPRMAAQPPALRMSLHQLRLDDPWCGAEAGGDCVADAMHARAEYPELQGEAAECPGLARVVSSPAEARREATGCSSAPRSRGECWVLLGLAITVSPRRRRVRCD